MPASCLHCCRSILLQTENELHQQCSCTLAGAFPAPNQLTVLHVAALRDRRGLAAAVLASAATAAGSTAGALAATLDGSPKWELHALLHSCGLHLTDDKHVSKFYRRMHGATALEVAVALGHTAPAADLLAAGAAVRPRAWAAAVTYCPHSARDKLTLLLAAYEVRSCWATGHWRQLMQHSGCKTKTRTRI